ncbi:aspartate/glutamate racemase family protein [Janibacter sp. CX7]|uniref:aspartate/glutamate racemase family protein n=1 Tax=Janibacter sp. CX7 TaxID=2963431 RepID=UPI0020CD328F|nr:aspartate/glutamate racemase family protein [Janibacter sp. CX7]UTT65437.1 aspartate/glutamate racemase family protein [Janibacter sp. CX7]
MRLLGVLGGMGWSATAEYYRRLNEGIDARLGGLHSARVLVHSLDFQPVDDAENAGDWDEMARLLVEGARSLQAGGAEGIILAANTMHVVADQVADAVDVPFLHIAEATARRVEASRQRKVGLLATLTTMSGDFYTTPFTQRGIEVILPEEAERPEVDRIIYEELVHGVIKDSSRRALRTVLQGMTDRGAECVVLAGTELGLLLEEDDCPVPLHDTTAIHVDQALDWMLTEG